MHMAALRYKLVVFVPLSHADMVRAALHDAGAGRVGNYSRVSFSSRGIGRFRPEAGANPAIGQVGNLEEVEEERIEMLVEEAALGAIIAAIKKAHPYEEPAYDIYRVEGV